MAEEKKATEIIFEIKTQVNEILASIRDINFKYTLILDRLNKLVSSTVVTSVPSSVKPLVGNPIKITKIESSEEESEVNFPEYIPSNKSDTLKSKLQLALEQTKQEQDEEDQLTVASQQDGKRRNLRQHAESQIRQIPVQQRITYSDGKAVYMANVEILDINKNLIKQTKTNQVGKWLASLSPGNYQVKISKGSNALKPKVELDYQILIPDQDQIVDLGTKTV